MVSTLPILKISLRDKVILKRFAYDFKINASSICLDKIFFVLDKIQIVQDKNFVQG